ncbi:hypothetical protein BDN71DRAFT_1458789 [Pleurotus eryngii]|uniref:Uncharacterized protein n=1 Tax=Pleurotus eryngii TaxID=5323 RepID=A0A9P5ZJU7_PLEER|nr:hypothetical protein BDN71DRAFT_1458789 [Pleurotus eryngii]
MRRADWNESRAVHDTVRTRSITTRWGVERRELHCHEHSSDSGNPGRVFLPSSSTCAGAAPMVIQRLREAIRWERSVRSQVCICIRPFARRDPSPSSKTRQASNIDRRTTHVCRGSRTTQHSL